MFGPVLMMTGVRICGRMDGVSSSPRPLRTQIDLGEKVLGRVGFRFFWGVFIEVFVHLCHAEFTVQWRAEVPNYVSLESVWVSLSVRWLWAV